MASLDTVSARWLRRKDSVSNATPILIVSALSHMRPIFWTTVQLPPAALARSTAAHLKTHPFHFTRPNCASPPTAWPPADRRQLA